MDSITAFDFKYDTITKLVGTFSDEQKCIAFLESIIWQGKAVSPFDPASEVYKCKDNRYKCKNTGKYFNVKTGTIFENTKLGLRDWFVAIWLYTTHKGGLSSMELHREIGITRKTAWFVLHRLRKCSGFENRSVLDDRIEMDETYVGGKNKNRHAGKKIRESRGRSGKGKTPVFGMLEREGKVVSRVVPSTAAKDLLPVIMKFSNSFGIVYTDEWGAYRHLDEIYEHRAVNHSRGEYVRGDVHTNNIENFWSNVKRSITGVYRVISPKHMHFYVDEFVFRRNTCNFTPDERFLHLLNNVKNCRLTYAQLIRYASLKQDKL
jgi:transposase-like protein